MCAKTRVSLKKRIEFRDRISRVLEVVCRREPYTCLHLESYSTSRSARKLVCVLEQLSDNATQFLTCRNGSGEPKRRIAVGLSDQKNNSAAQTLGTLNRKLYLSCNIGDHGIQCVNSLLVGCSLCELLRSHTVNSQ